MSDRETRPCVYILASRRNDTLRNDTLYVGVTNDIAQRTWVHRSDMAGGFTKRYQVHRLVYVEFHATMPDAILREKQVKKWRRAWKLELIERDNPQWRDLYDDLLLVAPRPPLSRG
jgi:putative endonuclease